MNLKRVVRGAGVLTAGQIASQALVFVRNVALARLLGPAEMGVVVALGLTLTFLRMISDLSVDKLLVQDRQGDDPAFQGSMHSLHLIRGVFNALALTLLAWPLAALFHVPDARWAFQAVALAPFLRAFTNLDYVRAQRRLRYGPGVTAELLSQAVSTALAVGLGFLLRSYAAIVWVQIGQALAFTVATHLLAERRFVLAWRGEDVRRAIRFGAPLLGSALLLFVVLQGDHVLVGAAYSKEELAWYGVGFALAGVAADLAGRLVLSVGLPTLAHVQDQPREFAKRTSALTTVAAMLAATLAAGLVASSYWVVRLLYGPEYAPAAPVLAVAATALSLRLIRFAPTTAALARGDSMTSLLANVGRSLYLPGALLVVRLGWSTVAVALAGLVAEGIALSVAFTRASRRHGLPAALALQALAPFGLAVGLAGAGAYLFGWADSFLFSALLAVVAATLGPAVALLLSPHRHRVVLQLAKAPWAGPLLQRTLVRWWAPASASELTPSAADVS
ncbi:MAG: hypothetical protein D6824_05965 [Planctomycetota bacterium]|nr:MAG: hypothetical protein D6824_05965 [Planctomycetota bacterium]